MQSYIGVAEVHDRYGTADHVYRSGLLYTIVLPLVPAYNDQPAPPSIDWEAFDYAAWRAMHPQIKGEISLINFALELKDLKRLPDLWSKERARLKNLANAHLNYSFGWAPFISDVVAIYKALFDTRKRIQEFIDGAYKSHTLHYVQRIPASKTSSEQDLTFFGYARSVTVETTTEEVELHATMQFSYSVGGYSRLLQEIGGWMDALGINLNAQIVWNAIPFSFVVDWFFNVGEWLGSQKGEVLPVITSVTQYCHSVKYRQTRSVMFHCYGGNYLVYRTQWDQYTRERAIPRTSPGLHLSLPNLPQVLLGASLTVH